MPTHLHRTEPIAASGEAIGLSSEPLRFDYAEVTRGPGRAWWRTPLTLLILITLWALCAVTLMIGFTAFGLLLERPADWWLDAVRTNIYGPVGFLLNNLFLASFVPCVVLSNRIGQRIGSGFTHSVAGRWRWGWFRQVTLLLLPLVLLYAGASMLLAPPGESGQHPQLLAMLVIVWLTTPLQCAGEEYGFRGWFLQNIGGLFANRIAAWVVPTAMSTGLFALAHGSLDPWIVTDLALFSIAVSVMTWRTGGLEAAVALHTLNNVILLHFGLILGGFEESIINATTTGSAAATAFTLVTQAAALALVWGWAKRRGIQRWTAGPTRPGFASATSAARRHPVTLWQPLESLPPRRAEDVMDGPESNPSRPIDSGPLSR